MSRFWLPGVYRVIAPLLGTVIYLLACNALGTLGLLGEGTQVQLALPDLTRVLDTAVIEGQQLQLETTLEPLESVVLLLSNGANTETVTLNGFISPAGDDIMVLDERDTPVSLRGWLRTMQDIIFTLRR